jgi:DNA repair exonuclease SbcCD nuclease subunit
VAFALRGLFGALLAGALTWQAPPITFAVIGDNGTGETPQYDVARQMLKTHATQPFSFVLMMGDNMYGSQQPRDFVDKFETPYGPLLRMGIPFYAALGNHDRPDNRNYSSFNMNGQRYYSVVRGAARFFFLDTNFMEPQQVQWFERALSEATERWKIVIFHHPLYSDGDRHGPNVSLRVALEPLMIRYGVDIVLSGHEHIYERIKPQRGITYFIVGSSGQLRRGGMTPSSLTAAGFDRDQVFMVASIEGGDMTFQAISRTGVVVDSGVLHDRATSENEK